MTCIFPAHKRVELIGLQLGGGSIFRVSDVSVSFETILIQFKDATEGVED
jgi:hypothetical protein